MSEPEEATATAPAVDTAADSHDPQAWQAWYEDGLAADAAAVAEPMPDGVPEMPIDYRADQPYDERRQAWVDEHVTSAPPVDVFDPNTLPDRSPGGGGRNPAGFTGNLGGGGSGRRWTWNFSLITLRPSLNINRSRNRTTNFGSGNSLTGIAAGWARRDNGRRGPAVRVRRGSLGGW